MADNNYFNDLIKTLADRDIPKEKIELEITEQVFLDNRAESTFDTFKKLREQDVFISLDDWGTGCASLLHLSFRETTETRGYCHSIFDYVNGQRDITESDRGGVETLEQFKFVEGAGCDFVRGYYIARPLSEIDLIEFLMQSHKPVLKAVGKTSFIKSRCRSNLRLKILGYFIIPGDSTKQAGLSGFDNLAQFTYLHLGPLCGLSAVNYETDQK